MLRLDNNKKEKNIQENPYEKEKNKITKKKKNNIKLSKFLEPLVSKKTLKDVNECGNYIEYVTDIEEKKYKLYRAFFCKNRFCPMCSWRKSLKDSLLISILMKYIETELNYEFVFLTLTVKNIKGDELNDKIKEMNKAFTKMLKRAEIKNLTEGFIRKLEITYQKEKFITKELYEKKYDYYKKRNLKIGDLEPNFDTFHPHFHCVISVKKQNRNTRINQKRWKELWQESMKDKSITQIRVDDIKKKSDNKEVFEVAKYSAKDADYLVNENVFNYFYKALKGKQLITFSGCFKDALILYKLGKLDYLKEIDKTEYVYCVGLTWVEKKYILDTFRELSDEEYKEINKRLIDELDCEIDD